MLTSYTQNTLRNLIGKIVPATLFCIKTNWVWRLCPFVSRSTIATLLGQFLQGEDIDDMAACLLYSILVVGKRIAQPNETLQDRKSYSSAPGVAALLYGARSISNRGRKAGITEIRVRNADYASPKSFTIRN